MSKDLVLAISKIGDLLINSSITELADGTSKDGIRLGIPEYQRPYKWTAKNVNQLINDINEAMQTSKEIYRVGTLILHQDKKHNVYNIVDGQQRSITFSLLLRALCPDITIPLLDLGLTHNSYTIHNVSNNYRTIKRRMDKLEKDERERLEDYVRNNCQMIVVITSDLSEAFQFFDSQNARGKELYPHDLLKAYHLREMNNLDENETEKVVRTWEELDQKDLSVLFKEYLYRLKQWVQGNRAEELTEHNIELFKGISTFDNYPFAQYYKGAFAYAEDINNSLMPFVTGIQSLRPFQLNAPIVAGKPFFEYTKYYFDILADIRNNDKYEGYFIKGNPIVETLEEHEYKRGTGNRITRLMFDTAILLYVDRFCPERPTKIDSEMLDQFVEYAFMWAYSMRAQYQNVGWLVAQNYILGKNDKYVVNNYNIFKLVNESDDPISLMSKLADRTKPLRENMVTNKALVSSYLKHFKDLHFWEE